MERNTGRGWSRRALLASLAAVPGLIAEQKPVRAAARGRILPSEMRVYPDPATEFPVLRLTDPEHRSVLPEAQGRAIAQRNHSLVYSNDRTGSMQAYRLDLKSGANRQLTEAEALDPATVALVAGDRHLCFFDGPVLRLSTLANLHEHEVYRVPDSFERIGGLSLADDGRHALFVEHSSNSYRIRMVALVNGSASTVVESQLPLATPMPRPRRAGILYRRSDRLRLVDYDGQHDRDLPTVPGGIGTSSWSPDGRAVLYLSFPQDHTQLHTLRELVPDTNQEKLIAKTSQFVAFGSNGDASVFVGASGSKGSPHVLLLLRLTRREFTLCEHRASDAAMVAPQFMPSSQRIVFQSDRHGKMALYSMLVDKLVEKTETEAE